MSAVTQQALHSPKLVATEAEAAAEARTSRDTPGELRIAYCAFVAGLFGLLLFLPGLRNGFAYDDVTIVAQDPRVRSLANIGQIFGESYWRDAEHALYRPLTTLSFAFDWSLAPDSAAWFHFTNALAHGAACALVVLLLARFFSPAAALLGGLVFAAHPVHVEAVSNVVGRADVLAAVFTLGAAVVWTSELRLRHWSAIRIVTVAALAALALLSKESAVMLPALLVLVDAARGSFRLRSLGDYLRRNAGAYSALATVIAGFLALRLSVLGSFAPTRLDPTMEMTAGAASRVLTALQAWPEYLRLLAFPSMLLADYGPRVIVPAGGLTFAALTGGVLLSGCVVGGMVALARGHGRAALALLWFPVAILPVSNLLVPIGVLVAERTLYLPSFALSAAAASCATLVVASARLTRAAAGTAKLLAAAVVVLLAVRTAVRVPEWESTDRIMLSLVRDRPDAFRGQWHLARLARLRGDTASAIERYGVALRLWPHRHRLVLEAAVFAAETGRLRTAYDIAGVAVKNWPEDVAAQRLLAGTALDLGDTATARGAMRAGLRLSPDDDLLRRMAAAIPDDSTTRR